MLANITLLAVWTDWVWLNQIQVHGLLKTLIKAYINVYLRNWENGRDICECLALSQ